jgi:alpha-L-arabinofuranosidase
VPDARIIVDPSFSIGPVSRGLFGSFVEHLGRCVYDGLWEPGHPTADADGFRTDVIALVQELGISTVRYPGGNFVSGFNWEDGVGPIDERPRRLDLAWHSTESNRIGMHEFAGWLERVGGELMLAINLGTRGVHAALELLEYANVPGGTALSDRRAQNGRAAPFDVRTWCLGNEMDGPWQLGHRSADDYGRLAAETARAMRQLDPDVTLVVCGSSNSQMPTFGAWEGTVLRHTYELVDLISCHAYWQERDGDLTSFLASSVDMDRMIEAVTATADAVGASLRSPKRINISFDEWNVWNQDRFEQVDKIAGIDNWPEAPRLLEDVYTAADAVVVGSLLISLLNHADRVSGASLAQLVNVIAPIMTEPGGPAWRQTTFHPFALTSRFARGTALRTLIEVPQHDTRLYGTVSTVDAAATRDRGDTTVFLANRDPDRSVETIVELRGGGEQVVVDAGTLAEADPYRSNTLQDPEAVGIRSIGAALDRDGLRLDLPPASWTYVRLRDASAAKS